MNAEDIRRLVGGVIPPKSIKDVKVTAEEKEEISKMCPFYGPIVKGRVPGVEGSDQFLDGLAETFGRIWRALTEGGYQPAVVGLTLRDLQEADEQLSESGTGMLEAEYPMIDMHIPEKSSFGAGVRAAYGILEFGLSKGVAVPTVGKETLDQTRESIAEQLGSDLPQDFGSGPVKVVGAAPTPTGSDSITAGSSPQDNSGSGQYDISPTPKIFVFTAAHADGQWIVSWPADGYTVRELGEMMKMIAALFGEEAADRVALTTSNNRVVCHFTVESEDE